MSCPDAIALFPEAGSKQNISKRARLIRKQLALSISTPAATAAATAQATAKERKRSQGILPASIPLPSWRPEQVRQIRVCFYSLSLCSLSLCPLPLCSLSLCSLSLCPLPLCSLSLHAITVVEDEEEEDEEVVINDRQLRVRRE